MGLHRATIVRGVFPGRTDPPAAPVAARLAHSPGRPHVSKGFHGGRVHLHHVSAPAGPSAGQGRARQRVAVVPARRQDRRAGRQRRGQVNPAAHHGGARSRLLRRRRAGARGERRPAAPGAGPRPHQGRARQRRGGRRPPGGPAAPLRGDRRPARRDGAGRDGDRAGRVRRAPGGDRPAGRLGPRAQARRRHGRPARAAGRPGRDHPLRRRAPPRGPVPAAAVLAGPAAARRAHQPPRRRVGGLAGAPPRGVPRHRRGRDPRPLLPRQRGRLDPGAGSRQGHPVEGQLLVLARAEAHAPGAGGEGRVGAPEGAGPGAGVGAQLAQGPPVQEQGAHRQLREAGGRGGRAPRPGGGDPHPLAPAAGRPGARGHRLPRASATAC